MAEGCRSGYRYVRASHQAIGRAFLHYINKTANGSSIGNAETFRDTSLGRHRPSSSCLSRSRRLDCTYRVTGGAGLVLSNDTSASAGHKLDILENICQPPSRLLFTTQPHSPSLSFHKYSRSTECSACLILGYGYQCQYQIATVYGGKSRNRHSSDQGLCVINAFAGDSDFFLSLLDSITRVHMQILCLVSNSRKQLMPTPRSQRKKRG
jgi:hypothetical protein